MAAALAARAPPGSKATNVVLVEPAGMGDGLAAAYPDFRVINTTTDHMEELADGSCCAAIAQQAFHWFANEASVREVHRVLQPGGIFAVAWNMRVRDTGDWHNEFEQLLDIYHNDGVTPRQITGEWKQALRDVEGTLFTPLQHEQLRHEGGGMLRSVEGLVQWTLSLSVIAKQSEEVRNDIVERVRTLLATKATPVPGATEAGTGAPMYLVPMVYDIYWVQKL